MKVMTIVGTRPELIKLSCVIAELDKNFDHLLVHTGQNFDYELNQIFFDDMGIRKPNFFMEAAGGSAAETIGNVIVRTDQLIGQETPDALLIYGDTNSCLAVISAKRRKIPIFHMEAGNRCFDLRVPEEINRKIVDHLSDVNMVISEHARRYLIGEGIRPDSIIKVGSSMAEVLQRQTEKIENSTVLGRLSLQREKFFVASLHREENVDHPQKLSDLITALDAIAEKYQWPVVLSLHPRTEKSMSSRGLRFESQFVRALKPLSFSDYVALQKSAGCVISDSGTIAEEASLLGFPAVTIRDSHERPEGMDEGTVIVTEATFDSVAAAVSMALDQSQRFQSPPRVVEDYDPESVSRKVARIIRSYTPWVNRVTWSK